MVNIMFVQRYFDYRIPNEQITAKIHYSFYSGVIRLTCGIGECEVCICVLCVFGGT